MKNNFTGDMPAEEFKKYGHQLIDWIAEYFDEIENFDVLSKVKPGEIKNKLPDSAPLEGESFENIIKDLNDIILPGVTHWNHPKFMAYFNSTSSSPGILAELIIATFNINGMLWRTSPSSAELEETVLNWLKKSFNLPENFWGIIYDTASVSSLHAIAAAREQLKDLSIRQKGMSGRNDLPRLILYCSEQAHSSIDKAAITLGIGLEGIKKIPVDENFRMIPEQLQNAIDEDIKNGRLPFCVVATVGTTATTSIDPVKEIGMICRNNNIWLHVDAAYAGVTAIIPEKQFIFDGLNLADSLVINPHKWLFTPSDLSILYTSKPNVLKQAFSLVPEYLKTNDENSVINYMDYGIQLGRRFRALKLWFIIRYFGIEGLKNRIKEHIEIAKNFELWIKTHSSFELMAPVPFSTVCFRAVPQNIKNETELNKLNEKLMNKLNDSGKIFLSHTKLNGKFTIRLVVSGLRTGLKHMEEAKELLEKALKELI